MIPLAWPLLLSAFLFTIGVIGVLVRRNAIVIFMSVELMLNAANLAFVAFARQMNSIDGQVFVFFVMMRSPGLARQVEGLRLVHRHRAGQDADADGTPRSTGLLSPFHGLLRLARGPRHL